MFYQLPVYGTLRKLSMQMTSSSNRAKRSIKYGKLLEINNKIINIMELLSYVDNKTLELNIRINYLDKCLTFLTEIKLENRIIYDLGGFTKKGFSLIMKYEESIYRQLSAWRNKLIKNNQTPNNISSEFLPIINI